MHRVSLNTFGRKLLGASEDSVPLGLWPFVLSLVVEDDELSVLFGFRNEAPASSLPNLVGANAKLRLRRLRNDPFSLWLIRTRTTGKIQRNRWPSICSESQCYSAILL